MSDMSDDGQTQFYMGETKWNSEWDRLPKTQLIELIGEIVESRASLIAAYDEVKAARDHYGKQINEFAAAAKVAETRLAEREKFLEQQRKEETAITERMAQLKDDQIERLTKELNKVINQFDQVKFDWTCQQRVDMAKETLVAIADASAALGSGAQPSNQKPAKEAHLHDAAVAAGAVPNPNKYPNF